MIWLCVIEKRFQNITEIKKFPEFFVQSKLRREFIKKLNNFSVNEVNEPEVRNIDFWPVLVHRNRKFFQFAIVCKLLCYQHFKYYW